MRPAVCSYNEYLEYSFFSTSAAATRESTNAAEYYMLDSLGTAFRRLNGSSGRNTWYHTRAFIVTYFPILANLYENMLHANLHNFETATECELSGMASLKPAPEAKCHFKVIENAV